jgi:hypothetical protein
MLGRGRFQLALFAFAGVIPSGGAVAQPIALDPLEFQVNNFTPGSQGVGGAAKIRGGGFVVVWNSSSSPGTDQDSRSIQARAYSDGAAPLGDQFQVNTYTSGDQFLARVASDAEGNFVVVWNSRGSAGSDTDMSSVQMRRFRADGTPLDPADIQVNTYTTGNQITCGVAADAQGNFVVAWENSGSYQGYSIQARRFAASGMPLDPVEFQVNTYISGRVYCPVVAADLGGNFVVVWESYGSFGTDHSYTSIQARRFSASGNPLDATEFQVNAYTPASQELPRVAMAPGGDFVVVWESFLTPGNYDHLAVLVRRFAADGTPLAPTEFLAHTVPGGGNVVPDVATNAGGDFIVAWGGVANAGNDPDGSVKARRFRSDGTPADGQESQLNVYTTGLQDLPRVAAGPDGDFVVAWTSYGSFGDDPDWSVQARRYGRPTIPVTSTSGGIGGPGCTLRDAITAANSGLPVGDCPEGNEGANLDLPAGSTITLTEADNGANGLPLIERPVTIRGHGSRIERDPGLACPVGPEFRLFEVPVGGVLTLEDVAVSNGCLSSDSGAGVLASGGSVVLRKASIEGNEAGSDGGGVAVVNGNLIAYDSTVRGNLSGGAGGGVSISGDPGWLLLDRATISENVAASGGGLSLSSAVPALVRNATFSGNEATVEGGGFELTGTSPALTLDFSSVVGNASPFGAGAMVGSGVLSIHGSLVGEGSGGADCASGAGGVVATGANLDTDGSCAALAGGNVMTVASFGLGPLADNGGWVRTHLPLPGSPVLDAAPACAAASGAPISLDARAYPRPTDDDGNGTPACDLGAVERGPIFLDGFESGDTGRWSLGLP